MKEFNLGDRVNVDTFFYPTKGTVVAKRTLKIYGGVLINYDVELDESKHKLIEYSPYHFSKI